MSACICIFMCVSFCTFEHVFAYVYVIICACMCVDICYYEIWSQISIRTDLRKGWRIHRRLELWFYTNSIKVASPGSPWALALGHVSYCLQTGWFDCLAYASSLNGTPLLMTAKKGWTYVTRRLLHFHCSLAPHPGESVHLHISFVSQLIFSQAWASWFLSWFSPQSSLLVFSVVR